MRIVKFIREFCCGPDVREQLYFKVWSPGFDKANFEAAGWRNAHSVAIYYGEKCCKGREFQFWPKTVFVKLEGETREYAISVIHIPEITRKKS